MNKEGLESRMIRTDIVAPYQLEKVQVGPVEFYGQPVTAKLERFWSTGDYHLKSDVNAYTIKLRNTTGEYLCSTFSITSNMILTEPVSISMEGYFYTANVDGQIKIETMTKRHRFNTDMTNGPTNTIYIQNIPYGVNRLFRERLITFIPSAVGFTYGDTITFAIRRYSTVEDPESTSSDGIYVLNVLADMIVDSPIIRYV